MRAAFLGMAMAALFGGAALAEETVVERYDEDTGAVVISPDDDPAMIEEDGPVIVEEAPPAGAYVPPVYGWRAETPPNCGVFKYWDGDQCADARYDPPSLD